jgi:NAD(P)-dependent dehydrogenase (short-subunit alcohol dehydrogenase family)
MANMEGKVVVLTGGTSGIGQVAAEAIAAMGARMLLVARDRVRSEGALERLRRQSTGAEHRVYFADLSRLADTKRVANEIAAAEPHIDVLINNAGAMFSRRQVTEDGLELTLATNHVSYFVLTHFLRERLIGAAPARIINTASDAHRNARLDFDDLQSEKGYRGFAVYSRSKLANILFTRELARRLKGTGVTANSLHPGFVATRFGDNNGGFTSSVIGFLKKFALTPEKGAETIIYLAASDEPAAITGKYFHKCEVVNPSKQAQDDEAAKRLWQETERLARLHVSAEQSS